MHTKRLSIDNIDDGVIVFNNYMNEFEGPITSIVYKSQLTTFLTVSKRDIIAIREIEKYYLPELI